VNRTGNVVKNTQEESILDKSKENKIAPSEYGCADKEKGDIM